MVKKKVNKKVSKSEPVHYKNLNFNKKIISIVLIVLAIGVIGSIFPGEDVTGMQIFDNPAFTQAKYTLNNMITTVFDPINISNIIVYERFVFFLLLFTLLSLGLKTLQIKGIQNAVIASVISLISVWFIPEAVFAMIGVTYSTVYASFLILVPILLVGFLIWKMPKTRGGYAAKAITAFILLMVFGAVTGGAEGTRFGTAYDPGGYFATFVSTIVLVLFILTGWFLIKALTMSDQESKEGAIKKAIAKSTEKIGNSMANAAATIVTNTGGTVNKQLKKMFKSK